VGYVCASFSLPRPRCSRLRPDVRDKLQRKGKVAQADSITKNVGSLIQDFQSRRLSNVNCSNTRELWKAVKNANHEADERNSISGNIGDADIINHYFADVATDASYDMQAVTNFLRAECNTSVAESFLTTKCTGV